MKKILCIMIALTMAITAVGCSGGTATQAGQSPQSVKADAPAESAPAPSQDNTPDNAAPKSDKATVEEQVLLEQDGIKVTLKSLESDGFMGPELKVLVENDSDKPVIVQTADVSINGIMSNPSISCSVEPKKKANDSITFSGSALEAADIATIKDVELKLLVLDPDTFSTIIKTDPITFTTSATDYVQTYDDSGLVALDRDGYKLVVKKLESEDSIWGAELYVYVENNSDKDVAIQIRDTSINGFMVNPSFSCNVLAGKKAFDTITFMESSLTDNGITDISEIETTFMVLNNESFVTILESEKITITF